MNIIILTAVAQSSGGTRQAAYLAEGFKARGHTVHFVGPEEGIRELAEEKGLQWHDLPKGFGAANRLLRSLMPAHTPTVVHAFHNRGIKLAAYLGTLWRFLRLPVICVVHRGVISRPHNPLPYLLPGISGYFVNSLACAKTLPLLWRRGRCHVVNNGIPEDRLKIARSADEIRAELNIPKNDLVIGAVASAQKRKAVDRLLEGYAGARTRIPSSTLVVVGVNPEKWTPLCRALGIKEHVRLVPFVKSVSEYLQIFNLKVFPPYSVESQPNVVLEAMLLGVPVIASRIGGVPELLPEDCLFKPGDVYEIADKIVEVITDDKRLSRMSEENRSKKHLFTLDRRLDVLLEHYTRLLGEHPAGRRALKAAARS